MLEAHKGGIFFYEYVKQMDLDGKKGLGQDVHTRWNSTF